MLYYIERQRQEEQQHRLMYEQQISVNYPSQHLSSTSSSMSEHLLGQSMTVNTKEAMSAVQDLWQSSGNSSRLISSPVVNRMHSETRNKLSFDIHIDSSMTQNVMANSKMHYQSSFGTIPTLNDQENHYQHSYSNHEHQNHSYISGNHSSYENSYPYHHQSIMMHQQQQISPHPMSMQQHQISPHAMQEQQHYSQQHMQLQQNLSHTSQMPRQQQQHNMSVSSPHVINTSDHMNTSHHSHHQSVVHYLLDSSHHQQQHQQQQPHVYNNTPNSMNYSPQTYTSPLQSAHSSLESQKQVSLIINIIFKIYLKIYLFFFFSSCNIQATEIWV